MKRNSNNNGRGNTNAVSAALGILVILAIVVMVISLFGCEDEPINIGCEYTLTMTLDGQDVFYGDFIDFIKQDPIKNNPYIVTVNGDTDECYIGKYQIILVE